MNTMEAIKIERLSKTRREITIPESLDPDFCDEIDAYLKNKRYRREVRAIVSGLCEEVRYYHGAHCYGVGFSLRDSENHTITFELVRVW